MITSTLLTLVVVPVLYSYLVRSRKSELRYTDSAANAVAKTDGDWTGGGATLGEAMPADKL